MLETITINESRGENLFSRVSTSLPNAREGSNAKRSRVESESKELARDLGLNRKPSERSDLDKIAAIVNKARNSNNSVDQTFGKATIKGNKVLVPYDSLSKGWSSKFLQLILICALKQNILELATDVGISIESEGSSLRVTLTRN